MTKIGLKTQETRFENAKTRIFRNFGQVDLGGIKGKKLCIQYTSPNIWIPNIPNTWVWKSKKIMCSNVQAPAICKAKSIIMDFA